MPEEEVILNSMLVVPAVACKPNKALGVVVLIPTFPWLVTLKKEVPEEEATLNGSMLPAVPWMLKLMLDDVAFCPATVPLSSRVPIVAPVEEAQTITYPLVPPESVPPPPV